MADKRLRDQIERGLKDLRELGSEITDQMKRAGSQARDKWKDVEPKLAELEGKLVEQGDKVEEAAGELFTEIGGALKRFATRLRSPDGDGSGGD